MATVKDIIERAYTKVNGEYEALAESSDDFKTYLNVLNQVLEIWFQTPYVHWQSLFNLNFTLTTPVAANVLQYTIQDITKGAAIVGNTPFDAVYFVDGTGKILKTYTLTDQALFDASTATEICKIAGDKLVLKSVAPEIVGATIKLPVYSAPPQYSDGSTTVNVDSVPWLVTSMAAFICDASPVPFIARNADKYYKEAAIYMKTMKDNNKKRQHLVIKSAQKGNTPRTWQDVMALGYLQLKDL